MSRAVFVESKYRAKETWLDKDGKPFYPGIQYYVGGNTKVYGAALLRFRERDFGEVRHHGGISPAWPLSYEDFEPYYTKAEYLYHVHGQRGVDPTEGPASAPYRYPPVSHEPRIQELFDDFRRLGHHPFPLPLGILLDEAEGKALHNSACVRCAAFDGFPCLVNGKADAQVICVDPALEHSNVELLTGAYVERLETNPSGRVVTKVIVTRKGASGGVLGGYRRGRLRGGQLRGPAFAVRERQTPWRPGKQLRCGRPALHAAQLLRLHGHLQGSQSDGVPEDSRIERLLFSLRRLGLPSGRDPDARQVRWRNAQGGSAWLGGVEA